MLNKQGLIDFFKLEPGFNAPKFLIYTALKSNRLEYTCKFIFNHGLGSAFSITSDEAEFGAASGYKINYSAAIFENVLQIKPEGLLTEKGLRKNKPVPVFLNGMMYLFPSTEDSNTFQFDIFSAVFYSISRYEEWLEHKRDQHDRFEAAESLFFANGYHLKPVLEIWIKELAESLQKKYPDLLKPVRE